MSIVIVPNVLSEAIYKAVDKALEDAPQFKSCRENIYSDILWYYNEHGHIPHFSLILNTKDQEATT